MNNVFFEGNTTEPHAHSLPELRKLRVFLTDNPGCSIELGCAGSASENGEQARLAAERARAVANYLTQKGIEKNRIATHAYVATKKKRRDRKKKPTIALANVEKIEIKITDIK